MLNILKILFHSETKITLFYLFLFAFICCTTRCDPLSSVITRCITRCITHCDSLSLVVIRCHSLSLVVPHVVTRCHSLSFFVTRCHSLSLVAPVVVTRCTTRLLFYKRSKNSRKRFQKFKTSRTHHFINQRSYLNISLINRQKHLLVAISW